MPIRSVPANGFGWIALAQLVNRVTADPYGTHRLAEKFSYRIWAQKPDFLNSLNRISLDKGYWIMMSENDNFNINGREILQTTNIFERPAVDPTTL